MRRIDTASAAADLHGRGKNGWRDGNPQAGVRPTQFNAAIMNSIQEEIANIIELMGTELDPADNAQAGKLIKALADQVAAAGQLPLKFKVEAYSGDLNTLKTDGIYAVLSPSQSRNLPAGSRGGKLVAVSGADGRIAHQYWHEAYSTNVWERHKTSMNNEDWSPWVLVQGGTPAVAAGSVMWFAATRPPEGWLVADGSRLARTAYPALFAAIGTAFNQSGDTAQYFRLPDLRGEFVRGWDGNRGIDSGRAFGSAQADEFRSHKHAMPISGNSDDMFENLSDTKRIRVTLVNDSDWNNVFGYHKDDYTASGGTETRPRNIALLPIIKY